MAHARTVAMIPMPNLKNRALVVRNPKQLPRNELTRMADINNYRPFRASPSFEQKLACRPVTIFRGAKSVHRVQSIPLSRNDLVHFGELTRPRVSPRAPPPVGSRVAAHQ